MTIQLLPLQRARLSGFQGESKHHRVGTPDLKKNVVPFFSDTESGDYLVYSCPFSYRTRVPG